MRRAHPILTALWLLYALAAAPLAQAEDVSEPPSANEEVVEPAGGGDELDVVDDATAEDVDEEIDEDAADVEEEVDGEVIDPLMLHYDEPTNKEFPDIKPRWAPTSTQRLKVWGFNDAMRTYNKESYFGRFFYSRDDQVITAARLILELNDEPPITLPSDIRALEVWLNGEIIRSFDRKALLEGPREVIVIFPEELLVDDNKFILRFAPFMPTPCQFIVQPGSWFILKDGQLDVWTAQLPLPNDLAQLPLPFFDQRSDREPEVPIAILADPSPATFRAAALVASFFGMYSGSAGVLFPVTLSSIPKGHAVVITTTEVFKENVFGTIVGPTVRMIDHPLAGQANYKLLVVQGRDVAELELAALNLATSIWNAEHEHGELVIFSEEELTEEMLDDRQKKRDSFFERAFGFLKDKEVRLADLISEEEMEELTHRGHAGGTLRFEFRIAPKLLAEPAEFLELDLEYLQRLPAPFSPAKLDVEFNGIYLKTLPNYGGGLDAVPHVERLQLPRNQLRGVNRLQVHVSALQHPPLCNADSRRLVENTVTGDTMLRLAGEPLIEQLPDVEAFVYEGLPYSRERDLGDTTFVLPEDPSPQEISAALSAVSNLAGATGNPCSAVDFVPEAALDIPEERSWKENLGFGPGELDRHIIVVSAVATSPLLRRWSDRLPLSTTAGIMRVRTPTTGETTMGLLRGRWTRRTARDAMEFLARAEHPGAVMGMESPFAAGQSVIVITANLPEDIPAIIDLQGYTEERIEEGGDLLLIEGEDRRIYRIGSTFSAAATSVGNFAFLRWALSSHWLLLFPLLLIAAFLMAFVLKRSLQRRVKSRLSAPE